MIANRTNKRNEALLSETEGLANIAELTLSEVLQRIALLHPNPEIAPKEIAEISSLHRRYRNTAAWHKDRIQDLKSPLCRECDAAGEIAEAHR